MNTLAAEGHELFVRHAELDGRSIARLRVIERADSCVVEGEVFPRGAAPALVGPYTFADAAQATAFVSEATESLVYLGCEVRAQ